MTPDGDVEVIAVLGVTGTGKSTFINVAAGHNASPVGRGLKPCTMRIKPISVSHPRREGCNIVLVDTPGFDQPSLKNCLSDTEILKKLADWLKMTYNENKRLTGFIYLWDITTARGTSHHLLDIFCGAQPPLGAVVATTKWSAQPTVEEGDREAELRQNLVESDVVPFTNDQNSAWDIIDLVLRQQPFDATKLRVLLKRINGFSTKRSGSSVVLVEMQALFRRLLGKR